jgi:nucleotide-binding universal stress UspA family protein
MFSAKTILCPVDFSDCSRSAFRLAGVLAGACGARILVLHVAEKLGPLGAFNESRARPQSKDHKTWPWTVLKRFRVRHSDVQVEHRLVEGNPAREILLTANQFGSDLIVMGTHGRTRLGRMLTGSVTEQVLGKARCPVVTVKMPHAPRVPATSTKANAVVAAEYAYVI